MAEATGLRHPNGSVRGGRQRKDQRLSKRFGAEILEETLKSINAKPEMR
ncbi:uncharacterized protein FFB20_04807 [Fusarium fujikuroi]|nr:uncharacterized protein FFB20_04807 [Fusarium fujikuroi]SCN76753.1 uncharacterized protein FFE2_03626 [Fusarium fujikuroi]SCN78827.1 uncharacterized protein FFM5_01959 [Fusarium fujikuroi]SCN95052.1 uncharacterized protein FFC1_07206 [Fusarium fujikuroi]SCO33528.1 uncharacterized protein FFMR_03131 [Fusarium fujikuroi]